MIINNLIYYQFFNQIILFFLNFTLKLFLKLTFMNFLLILKLRNSLIIIFNKYFNINLDLTEQNAEN